MVNKVQFIIENIDNYCHFIRKIIQINNVVFIIIIENVSFSKWKLIKQWADI